MTETSPLPDAAAPPVLPEGSPFAAPWDLDLGLPDFTGVRHEDIAPAVHAGMAAQRAQWEAVAGPPWPTPSSPWSAPGTCWSGP